MESTAHIRFVTNENKGLLWKLLDNGKFFNDISGEYVSNVKYEFDKKIQQLNTSSYTVGYSLLQLNKLFISEMISYLEKFKDMLNKNKTSLRPVNTIQDEFEKKKEDFNSLMMKKPPNKVDFSDKLDDTPIGSNNIEAILAETIARRERELNVVLDKNKNDNSNSISNSNNINIKIGNDLKKEDVLNVKQVRFSDNYEVKEHSNFEYDDNDEIESVSIITNKVDTSNVVDDTNKVDDINKVDDTNKIEKIEAKQKDSIILSKKDYDIFIEKIDRVLKKSKQDILDIFQELLSKNLSKQV